MVGQGVRRVRENAADPGSAECELVRSLWFTAQMFSIGGICRMGSGDQNHRTKLLILDLDETLIFASETRLAYPEDFRLDEYFVYKRPGLSEFIEFAFQHFKVAVWTASDVTYADAAVTQIFGDRKRLEFIWTRERCTWKLNLELGTGYWIKDLKKVAKKGHALNQVLVVDDSPRKLERSYGNYIRVVPFGGDASDRELEQLERYLLTLRDVPNVRSLDKRTWRSEP